MKTLRIALALVALTLISTSAFAIKVHQDLNMQDANLINAGGNKITNVAAATETMDAVNYGQLTNAMSDNAEAVNSLSNYVRDVMITNVADLTYITNEVDDIYVNVEGDTMTGSLTIISNLVVNGKIMASDIYALTQTVMNLTVSNACIVTTNLQVDGIITGVIPTNIWGSAVTYEQMTNLLQQTQNDTDLQTAYDNGNTITTAGGNDVEIGGSEALSVTAAGGVDVDSAGGVNVISGGVDVDAGGVNVDAGGVTVNGGVTVEDTGVQVDAGGVNVDAGGVTVNNGGGVTVNDNGNVTVNGGQVQINGANDSIRRNGAGRIQIWSDGSLALEFE